jgi:hypothetical protein
MAAHAIAAAALSPAICRSHCRRRLYRAHHATNGDKDLCVGACVDLAMHGNRVAAMELRPVATAGTDCRAHHHAAGTDRRAYLAGTGCRAYLAGTDCRVHHATGTDRRAYIASADCRAYHAGTGCRGYIAGTVYRVYIAGADCRAYHAGTGCRAYHAGTGCRAHHPAGTDCGDYLTGTVYRIYLAGADCRAHHAAGTGCRAYIAGALGVFNDHVHRVRHGQRRPALGDGVHTLGHTLHSPFSDAHRRV